jgi:hypothetical protein
MRVILFLSDGQKIAIDNVVKSITKPDSTKGENSKLNYDLAQQIRQQWNKGNVTRKQLAEEYRTSIQAIDRVIQGYTWTKPK